MTDYFTQLRKKSELIKMREAAKHDWREELLSEKEEHPFVEVMPEGDKEKTCKKSDKKDKKEEKVEEGYKQINPEYQYVGHARAREAAKKAVEKGDREGMKRHLDRAEAIKSPTRRQMDLTTKKAKFRKEEQK